MEEFDHGCMTKDRNQIQVDIIQKLKNRAASLDSVKSTVLSSLAELLKANDELALDLRGLQDELGRAERLPSNLGEAGDRLRSALDEVRYLCIADFAPSMH